MTIPTAVRRDFARLGVLVEEVEIIPNRWRLTLRAECS